MGILDQLGELRAYGGAKLTQGIPDNELIELEKSYPELVEAVGAAVEEHKLLRESDDKVLKMDEQEQLAVAQEGILNFYNEDAINPFVPIAARGPWVVTLNGAVLHDNGGYGMLGFGHCPEILYPALGRKHVMANVMTPSLYQRKLVDALRNEIGHNRTDGCPFSQFLCMNSGSEAVAVAARISDINVGISTGDDGKHKGKVVKQLSLKGSFHGRTHRPAQFSDSCRKTYSSHLGSFQKNESMLLTVEVNNISDLKEVFANAEANGVFIEAFFMEPVMGEGNPGVAVQPDFYKVARELTLAHGTLLLVDSIQAGLRATGNLSVVDYPGFENLPGPDLETYSKALNGGQYPLSVLAMSPRAAELYRRGVYGNTMTGNPKACNIAVTLLGAMTPEIRNNIVARGQEMKDKLNALKDELKGPITRVEGSGLLLSAELTPNYKSYGKDSVEEYLRFGGIGVIHGGQNSLRFTPNFTITSGEIDVIVSHIKEALLNGPGA